MLTGLLQPVRAADVCSQACSARRADAPWAGQQAAAVVPCEQQHLPAGKEAEQCQHDQQSSSTVNHAAEVRELWHLGAGWAIIESCHARQHAALQQLQCSSAPRAGVAHLALHTVRASEPHAYLQIARELHEYEIIRRSLSTATTGSTRPSSSSSAAPPPVLMWLILLCIQGAGHQQERSGCHHTCSTGFADRLSSARSQH